MMTEFPETRLTLLAGIQHPENHAAWDEFVVLYRPVIYRMARRRGLQDADAQDLAQDVLVRIAKSIEHYQPQPETRFRHWLRRVARNAIITVLSRTSPSIGLSAIGHNQELSEPTAEALLGGQELEIEVQREIYLRAAAIVRTEVNAETWLAFELTVIQGQACEAAAKVLGKSIGTIYASRSRIMKRLRDQVQILNQEDA